MTGHLVVACDKFKGSLTATQVADHIRAGVASVRPDLPVTVLLVSDGGDGALDVAESAGYTRVPVTAAGPTGERLDSSYAVKDGVAVVEMAAACGLVRLSGGVTQPLTASSRGVGDVMRAALDAGVSELVLAIGGSASSDGGAGMLSALGARVLDASGAEVGDGGAALAGAAELDLTGLHPRLREVPITVACDVHNPLLGENGAVAIFAPQKGADDQDRRVLEGALTRWADLVTRTLGRDDRHLPGAGAAGGVGYAAQAVLGARMRPGIELFLHVLGFDDAVRGAALVITGEGSLDRQTLLGKTPAGVASAAQRAGVPVVAVCGQASLAADDVSASAIDAVFRLTDLEPDPQVCMDRAGPLLERLSAQVARDCLR